MLPTALVSFGLAIPSERSLVPALQRTNGDPGCSPGSRPSRRKSKDQRGLSAAQSLAHQAIVGVELQKSAYDLAIDGDNSHICAYNELSKVSQRRAA